jgi:very-short-patch-repair endonuclease
MARTARIPRELTTRPFSLAEAREAGLTLSALRGSAWRRLGSQLYCWEGVREDAWLWLVACKELLPPETVFAGATAGWMHGLDLDPIHPVEVVAAPLAGVRSRSELTVRRCAISPDEVVTIRGLQAMNLLWTLCDLCLRHAAIEALIALDMAIRARLTTAAALGQYATSPRAGARRLRLLARVAAPAESPMETRLRWLLIQAGLPRPEVQTNLHDAEGRFVGRADLYYPASRLVLEYDGGNHRDRLVEDDRRQNLVVNAGFRLLRFTAADIYSRPAIVQAQVRGALLAPNVRIGSPAGERLTPKMRNHAQVAER